MRFRGGGARRLEQLLPCELVCKKVVLITNPPVVVTFLRVKMSVSGLSPGAGLEGRKWQILELFCAFSLSRVHVREKLF